MNMEPIIFFSVFTVISVVSIHSIRVIRVYSRRTLYHRNTHAMTAEHGRIPGQSWHEVGLFCNTPVGDPI